MCAISVTPFVTFVTLHCAILALISFGTLLAISLTKADNQILRVNMANIRRKIEKNPADPQYIFTEIGVGYRMLDGEN